MFILLESADNVKLVLADNTTRVAKASVLGLAVSIVHRVHMGAIPKAVRPLLDRRVFHAEP
eukprot:916500-Rhodomonas_salina.1